MSRYDITQGGSTLRNQRYSGLGNLKLAYGCDHMMTFEHDNHTVSRWICEPCGLSVQGLKDLKIDTLDPAAAWRPTAVEPTATTNEVPFRSEVLLTANDLINGDRNKQYGSPAENFRVTAEYWSTYLGVTIEAHDVCNLMVLLKLARTKQGFKDDTYIDGAGYLALAGELHRDATE